MKRALLLILGLMIVVVFISVIATRDDVFRGLQKATWRASGVESRAKYGVISSRRVVDSGVALWRQIWLYWGHDRTGVRDHAEKLPQLVHANLIDLASQIVDNRARNGRITYYYSKEITNLGLTESGRTKNYLRKT